jgi:predicted nucleotidyltransferase component of viral defense system
VEQDLVICRALVSIYSDPFLSGALAFRGGTALHKLYLSTQARYSEDIDLVQTAPGPIKPIVERLDAALSWLPDKSFDMRRFGFRMRFRYESEYPPVEQMRLKVEVNTFEHFTELGHVMVPFRVDSSWFCGSCKVRTYALDELLGTKFRALYQRRKGRDLFDLSHALENGDVDDGEVLRCWLRYMIHGGKYAPSSAEFLDNMDAKMSTEDYCADVDLLLRPGLSFDARAAYANIRKRFISRIDAFLQQHPIQGVMP